MPYVLFLVGIFFLIKGADYLVEGSSSLAKRLGVPTIVIGLTVVAFGTSMPELVVSLIAAINHSTDVAFGNIIGSNVANILLILGFSATIRALKVKRETVWREIPFSLLGAVLLLVFVLVAHSTGIDPSISRIEGIVLLLVFAVFMFYIAKLIRDNPPIADKTQPRIPKEPPITIAAMIVGGLTGLVLGGKWVVDGAVFMAQNLGLSELLISSTIIAVGTSLPELITSIVAVKKGNVDLAVGNVVGSNVFNILWVLGLSALLFPIPLPPSAITDILFVVGATFMLFFSMFLGRRHELGRFQGAFFVLVYFAYLFFLAWRG